MTNTKSDTSIRIDANLAVADALNKIAADFREDGTEITMRVACLQAAMNQYEAIDDEIAPHNGDCNSRIGMPCSCD